MALTATKPVRLVVVVTGGGGVDGRREVVTLYALDPDDVVRVQTVTIAGPSLSDVTVTF